MTQPILLRFHEVAIKGGNRGWFEERLSQNIRTSVKRYLGQDYKFKIGRSQGRLFLYAPWDNQIRDALTQVFGLTGFSPTRSVPSDLSSLTTAAIEEFEKFTQIHGIPNTFRVNSRRSKKTLLIPTAEIDRAIGSRIHDLHSEMKVQLKNPEVELGIEVREEGSFIWLEKFSAHGGLPVGTNGPLLVLMSGGIDSPIAALRMLRRGSACHFIHFYGTPFVGEDSLNKVEDLVRRINRFQPDPRVLHFVPFGKIQETIALATQPKLRTLLYRRMMLRVASRLACKLKIKALVTGESLGQVASQTLENLTVIDSASPIPVLRPLIGFNKDEIIREAREWGTYDISIRPAGDSCTLFADRHPATKAHINDVLEQEARFPLEQLVEDALNSIEVRKVGYQ